MGAASRYDYAGRATSRVSASLELEGFVHDSLDRLTKVRRNGAVSEMLEYAPTGELAFRKLGTQGTWYVGAVGTATTADRPAQAGPAPQRSDARAASSVVSGSQSKRAPSRIWSLLCES